jgi:transposase
MTAGRSGLRSLRGFAPGWWPASPGRTARVVFPGGHTGTGTPPAKAPGRGTPAATKFALCSVARRYRVLSEEIAELEARIERVVREVAPELSAFDGVGPDTAAALLRLSNAAQQPKHGACSHNQ